MMNLMKRNRLCWSKLLERVSESPTTRRAGGLDYSAIGGKKHLKVILNLLVRFGG